MKINTRSFGVMEIDSSEIITFCQPIFGFDRLTDYVLLSDSGVGDSFLWLQSVQDEDVCFILVDPAVLPQPYQPKLGTGVRTMLHLKQEEQAVFRVIAVIPSEFTQSTVNLKSPVVIDRSERLAAQVMLEEDYPIRAPLVEGEEEGAC